MFRHSSVLCTHKKRNEEKRTHTLIPTLYTIHRELGLTSTHIQIFWRKTTVTLSCTHARFWYLKSFCSQKYVYIQLHPSHSHLGYFWLLTTTRTGTTRRSSHECQYLCMHCTHIEYAATAVVGCSMFGFVFFLFLLETWVVLLLSLLYSCSRVFYFYFLLLLSL